MARGKQHVQTVSENKRNERSLAVCIPACVTILHGSTGLLNAFIPIGQPFTIPLLYRSLHRGALSYLSKKDNQGNGINQVEM